MTMPNSVRRFRTRPRSARGALAAVLVAAAGALALAQPAFMRNMYTGPVVLPQVDPGVPVEDTIAVDGERQRDRLESRDLPNPCPTRPPSSRKASGSTTYTARCATARRGSATGR